MKKRAGSRTRQVARKAIKAGTREQLECFWLLSAGGKRSLLSQSTNCGAGESLYSCLTGSYQCISAAVLQLCISGENHWITFKNNSSDTSKTPVWQCTELMLKIKAWNSKLSNLYLTCCAMKKICYKKRYRDQPLGKLKYWKILRLQLNQELNVLYEPQIFS